MKRRRTAARMAAPPSRTSFVVVVLVLASFLLVRHHGDAFSIVTTIPSTARRRSATTRLYQAAAANGANGATAASSSARAGSQGYSLLRQPVSSWSVEKDPVYVPPKAGESEESLDGWWAGRLQSGQAKRTSSSILSNDDADGDDYRTSRRIESPTKTSVIDDDIENPWIFCNARTKL
jgi:hypothetical protein